MDRRNRKGKNGPIRVVIADDQLHAREGLRALLALCDRVMVVGEAKNGLAALDLVEAHRPDVVLMDARMPVLDGLAATHCIKEKFPGTRVILITMYPTSAADPFAGESDAVLLKGFGADELCLALRGAEAGVDVGTAEKAANPLEPERQIRRPRPGTRDRFR